MSLKDYLDFLADRPRVEAFRRAIESSVRPGEVVLDLGTGLGTYALFAARCGARVIAVEPDPIIDAARRLAAENGLADRITFVRGHLERSQPPERADLLVFEDFAPHLFEEGTAKVLEDARRRWLRPAARSIPASIGLEAAPVCAPQMHRALTSWRESRPFDLDVAALSRLLLNRLHDACWNEDVLLAEAKELARVKPLTPDALGLDTTVRWRARRDGTLHGLAIWIDLRLTDVIEISNRPSGRSGGWNQRFLALAEPVEVRAGDGLEARIWVLGSETAGPRWWRWQVIAGGRSQSMDTFRGQPLTLERLRRARIDRRPVLGPEGRVRRAVLELIDGERTVLEIAREVQGRFPGWLVEGEALRLVSAEIDRSDHRLVDEEG